MRSSSDWGSERVLRAEPCCRRTQWPDGTGPDGKLGADRAQLEFTWDLLRAQSNVAKHGVSFVQAATVLLDALELAVFDATHSQDEERWFTLGTSSGGRLLVVSHTNQHTDLLHLRQRQSVALRAAVIFSRHT